jgi:ferric-dicitrate binding protein FerR (iron transport regulator)
MEVLDETLQSVRVSGVFSSTEPASLLRFLREQVRLQVNEDDESVRISRR